MSRLPPAGPSETAAADGLCPICLGDLENATCVEVCRHYFCFICIWEWAKLTETCPLCKQPFKRLLRAGTADNNHEERVVEEEPLFFPWRAGRQEGACYILMAECSLGMGVQKQYSRVCIEGKSGWPIFSKSGVNLHEVALATFSTMESHTDTEVP